MSEFRPGMPAGAAAQHRFEPPPTLAQPSTSTPAGHEHEHPARPAQGHLPSLADTGSVVLAGLPKQIVRNRWQARKTRDIIAGGMQRDGRHTMHAAGSEVQGDQPVWFGSQGQASSQQDHSGRDGTGSTGKLRSAEIPDIRSLGAQPETLAAPTHMARHAADLPVVCHAFFESHGRLAMPAFLRGVMESLVVCFMRDVAERFAQLEQRAVSGSAIPSADAILPVRDACDEFLRVMRPLYSRYVSEPRLFADARAVLCQAQPLLQREVDDRGADDTSLRRVMRDSVYPLLPVILMGAMPRPVRADASVATA